MLSGGSYAQQMSVLGKHRLNLYNTTGEQVRVKGCEGCKWAVSFFWKLLQDEELFCFFHNGFSVPVTNVKIPKRFIDFYRLATIATSFDINIVSG